MDCHVLKVYPQYFDDIDQGLKTFEVRFNDRNYHVGDILFLREFEPAGEEYSGRILICKVIYILSDPLYVRDGFVILGFDLISSVSC